MGAYEATGAASIVTPTNITTSTYTPTQTPTAADTDTPPASSTPTPTAMATSTPPATSTPTRTPTVTNTPTNTSTTTSTYTNTATSTYTPTRTPTVTNTPTAMVTNTPPATSTPTQTPTAISTRTNMATSTYTPTRTPTVTSTPTNTVLPSSTPMATAIPSNMPTGTSTFTLITTQWTTLAPGGTPSPTPILQAMAFFVDGVNGSDSNPGTSRDKAWKTIQKAANSVSAGTTITVLAGNYPERIQMKTSGSSGKMITFLAEGTVTMDGFTVKADYVRISGFDISNTPDDYSDGWGIYYKGAYCLIENNYIHFATHGGVTLRAEASDTNPTHDCVVRNNKFYRNSQVGIEVYGNNNLVEGNEIWGTIQYHPAWKNPPDWVDANGINFFGTGHIFRNNYIHGFSFSDPYNKNPVFDCFQTFTGSGHAAGKRILFEDNRCDNAVDLDRNSFGRGFKIDGGASDLLIRNNVIQAFVGVRANASSGIRILNNTFVSDLSFVPSYGPEGVHLGNTPDSAVENNIFYDFASSAEYLDSASASGSEVGFNLIFHSDGSTPAGSHSSTDLWMVNPRFVDPVGNYRLQPGSPAIDAGTSLADVTVDFNGIPRPQGSAYDIGAFEAPAGYASTPTPSATVTATITRTPTPSATVAATITSTPTPSTTVAATITSTPTPSATATSTPTRTPTPADTPTPTPADSETPSITPSMTPDGMDDSTPTPTPTP